MRLRSVFGSLIGAGTLAGAGLTAYAAWEARQYTLREVTVPVLPPGAEPLRVLHLSDIHLVPGQQRKRDWLAGLALLRPDLVVDTGDNIAHQGAHGPAALEKRRGDFAADAAIGAEYESRLIDRSHVRLLSCEEKMGCRSFEWNCQSCFIR